MEQIEHRPFSFMTQNWRAKPLISYRVFVDVIGATTTTPTCLTFRSELDETIHHKGIIVTDEQMENATSRAGISIANGITQSPLQPGDSSTRLIPDGP